VKDVRFDAAIRRFSICILANVYALSFGLHFVFLYLCAVQFAFPLLNVLWIGKVEVLFCLRCVAVFVTIAVVATV